MDNKTVKIMNETLLDDVKNYLDITWKINADEEKKLIGFISRGITYLSSIIGTCDFENETPEKELLLNYCMYARAGQTHEFKKNYFSDMITLQMNRWRDKQDAENKG